MTIASTVSTDALYVLLRDQLLNTADPDGNTLAAALSNRLWRIAAPDTGTYPYGLMTIKSPQMVPDTNGLKMTADLELLFFGRPRAQQPAIEALGDRAVAVLMQYRDTSSGLVYVASAVSESLPEFPAPADANIVQVRVLAKLHYWPVFLSRLAS